MDFKPLPIGVDNFERMINDGYYYIDKTLLIKELLDNKGSVNLFTRPRRFGKTLNISMLQYFFEDRNKDNYYLFDGLKIMEQGTEYTQYLGMYPVINLSLKSAKQPNFELAISCLKNEIVDEFRRHEYILESPKLKNEKEEYEKIVRKEGEIDLYVTSIKYLCKCLEKYYDKKVIILIDEYDVPLENSYFRGFYTEMVDFIRSLFESALKTNDSLEFAVITGCLRISKESIFTGLNNLNIISILNENYSEYFGFVEEEVKGILKQYNLEELFDKIKEWYDGYMFGETHVYNPWSLIKYIFDLIPNKKAFPISYWANTSSNSIVRSLIEKADLTTREEIEKLIAGETIEKPIHEDITYDEIYKTTDNLWNFMFFTGYLKKVDERMDSDDNILLTLKIPNKEVKYIFKNKILEWFNEKIKVKDLSVMYNAILEGDTETFELELVTLLEETISFYDSYESFYHGFLVGTLMNIDRYIIKSNREMGNGRSDILIRYPNRRGKAVIIEIKVAKEISRLEEKCNEALEQIETKRYDAPLIQDGYKDVIKYGIAFYKKDCMIKIKS